MLDLFSRFHVGVNLDDSWRYAGFPEPKSIIFPHLLSLSLPEGRVLDEIDESIIRHHGEEEPRTAADRASLAVAERMRDASVDYVRCWFSWRFFEPKLIAVQDPESLLDSPYAAWPMDNLVDTLTSHGVEIIPVLACGYQRMLPDGLSVDANPELYVKRAYVHARRVVRRYRDRVKYWQIENEPNWWEFHVAGGWRKGSAWMELSGFREKLLKVLNEAVHEEDQKAVTLINLEADRMPKDAAAYSQYCDMLGLDFYPNYRVSSPINTSVFREADSIAAQVGKPVAILETGYPSGPSLLGYSESKQAEYVEAACLEAFNLRSVNAVGIWRHIDTSWKSFPYQENHFGLVDKDDNPKPAWPTLCDVIKRIKGG